jgi:hypothetical protein
MTTRARRLRGTPMADAELQQKHMTTAIRDGVGQALRDVLVSAQEELRDQYGPEDGAMRKAIRDGVEKGLRGIKDQLEGIHSSLAFIGFMGVVIAVSLIVLIGMLGKSMGLWWQ